MNISESEFRIVLSFGIGTDKGIIYAFSIKRWPRTEYFINQGCFYKTIFRIIGCMCHVAGLEYSTWLDTIRRKLFREEDKSLSSSSPRFDGSLKRPIRKTFQLTLQILTLNQFAVQILFWIKCTLYKYKIFIIFWPNILLKIYSLNFLYELPL